MVSETKTTEALTLHRELKACHPMMIAIEGSIGIGLFVASGATISAAGPGGALFSYILIGLVVYFLMTSLGELAAYMPVSGLFSIYGQNYVEEGFGFVLGWNYWHNWTVTIAVDLVAVQLVMSWWFPDTPGWIWSALLLGVIFLLNYVSVHEFGEAEYWFSLVKVTTVTIFIVAGMMMTFGIFKGVQLVGWSNWTIGDAPFVDGFAVIIGVVMIAGFSFQGTELIGIVAGKSEDPEEDTPRAVCQVFRRILPFYAFAILVIDLIILYIDPSLLRNDVKDISVSPFTLAFQHADLLSAATAMNAVILTAVLSTGDSGMCASIRILYTLTCDGKAPRIFGKLSRGDIPYNALYVTTVVAGLRFLTSVFGNQTVYLWLLNTSGMTGFIVWLGIAISRYRFRHGYILQGHDVKDLSYRSGFFPLGPIFAFMLRPIITLGQNYEAFLKDSIDWGGVMATYIGIPLFLIVWFGCKLTGGTRLVRYSEMKFPGHVKK